ncbi:MAG: alpha-amylase family glycosyl hydrolase [Bacteroidales bacterium]|nr:alpha-amylase family glycosyl hydrolase [Bacteroidales bacterium]
MKKFLLIFSLVLTAALAARSQATSDPTPLREDSENVWIYFHADEGTKGLAGLPASTAIYAHTGACTNLGDWRYAPQWLDNSDKYRLEYVSENLWRLFIGDIREYYGIPANETVRRLAFVFRNADGSKEGKATGGGDIFIDVLANGQEVPPQAEAKPYPGGAPQMGAVRNSDGSVTFCLAAPGKSNVSIIGSWNDYAQTEAGDMYVDQTDGIDYFWQTVSGLKEGETYLYYYLVDGTISVGDPYANLVLDPDNDKYIPASVFPDLPAFPADKVPNVCLAVYRSDINDYDWQVKDFKGVDKENLIIYELLLRDFTGTEGKALGDGTVRGAIEKIPYLKSLGINAVELLPITEFSGNISWGYNPNFYFAPDKAYGTPDDYREFIDECHRQGIAVILDMVFNQSDWQHPWYRMYPAGSNPLYNATAPHAYSVLNDFNQGHPLVARQWADCVKYWLTEYNVDGFRFDLVKGLGLNGSYANSGDAATNAFNQSRIDNMRAIQLAMQEVRPDAYFINENLAGAQEENAMAAFGQLNWSNLNHQGCQYAMGYSDDSSLQGFYAPAYDRTWGSTVSYLESHDEQRLAYQQRTYGAEAVKQTKTAMKRLGSAAAQMLLAPGAHMIWQFSEMGNEENTKNADGGNNTDPKTVNWNMLGNPYRAGLVKNYSELAAIRNGNPEIFSADASFTSACKATDWASGRTMKSVAGAGSVFTFINPNVDKAITFSFDFPSKNNADFKILSTSYEAESTFDAAAGKVTVPANCYIVIGTSAVNAVEGVEADDSDAPAEYFNLQGIRIAGPAKGEIHIVRKGNKTYKAIAE